MTANISFPERTWLWLLTGSLDNTTVVGIIGAADATDPNLLRALAGRRVNYYTAIGDAIDASVRHDLVIDMNVASEPELGERLARMFSTLNENGLAIVYLDTQGTWPQKGEPVTRRLIGRYPGYSFRSMISNPMRGGDIGTNIYVIRCTRRTPYAYLFLDYPFSGKSNAAMVLSENTGLPMVYGDSLFAAIAREEHEVSRTLFEAVTNDCVFSNRARIDEFLSLIPQVGDRQPFILDRAVPQDFWSNVIDAVSTRGFRPIVCTLNHDRSDLLRDVLNSRSWRWTAPLRWLRARIRSRKPRARD